MRYITFAGFFQAAYNLAPESLSEPFSYHLPSDYSGHTFPCFSSNVQPGSVSRPVTHWVRCLEICLIPSKCRLLKKALPTSLPCAKPFRQAPALSCLFVWLMVSIGCLCVCVCVCVCVCEYWSGLPFPSHIIYIYMYHNIYIYMYIYVSSLDIYLHVYFLSHPWNLLESKRFYS